MSKNIFKWLTSGFLILLSCSTLLLTTGCQEEEDAADLFSSSYFHNGQTPVIDTILPINGDAAKLSAIGKIQINGKNFSANLADNLVNFNNVRGTVLSATPTQLNVLVPNYVSDSIYIRVDITGNNAALLPSNTKFYQLKKPVLEDEVLSAQEVPTAMCFDAAGTFYAAIENGSGVSAGIIKVANGAKSVVATAPNIAARLYSNIRIANGGNLYLLSPATRFRVWVIPSGTVTPVKFQDVPAADVLHSMDFDANMNMWVGGESATTNLYCIANSTLAVTSNTFPGKVRALRVYNGYLYVAGISSTDSKYRIYRYPIVNGTQLGTQELFFDFDQAYPGKIVSSMTISSDGYVYVGIYDGVGGNNSAPGIVLISPTGSVAEDYYSGALVPSGSINNSAAYNALMWDNAGYLYATRIRQYTGGTAAAPETKTEKKLVKINALKNGAVYFGR